MLRRHSRNKVYLVIYLPHATRYALHTEYLSQYEVDIYVSSDKLSTTTFIRENEVGSLLMVHDENNRDTLPFLRYIMQQFPDIQRILLSSNLTANFVEEAINKAHVNYFLTLPIEKDRILEIVRKSFKRYITVSRPAELIDELTLYVREFREEANTDPLTKLLNRRTFDEVIQKAINLYHEKQIPISLVMFDLDHFKKLNDKYGHAAGDAVLREFSNILKKNVRLEDSVFRYGGEEFAMVAHGDSKDDIKIFIERILKEVSATFVVYKGESIQFTFSAGIETMQANLTRDNLLQHADAALYHAKGKGRNQVVCFEQHMLEKLK